MTDHKSTKKAKTSTDAPLGGATEHNDTDDVLTELIKDHNEVRELFATVGRARSEDKKRELTRQIITELVKHSVAEEQYLYPATRRALPDGNDIADHEIVEHAEVERMLGRLEHLDVGDQAFGTVLDQVISSVLHHAEHEEQDLFPRLRKALDREELRKLGDEVRLAKSTAPTHPHPGAPDTPPLNLVGDPVIGLVDRVRDALTGKH